MRVLIVAFVAAICSIGFVTPFTQVSPCRQRPTALKVNIGNCIQPPCNIIKNPLINLRAQFKAVANADSLIGFFVDPRNVTLNGTYSLPDICNHLIHGSCPVKKGDIITIDYKKLLIPQLKQGDDMLVEFEVYDSNYHTEFCFDVTLKLVSLLTFTIGYGGL